MNKIRFAGGLTALFIVVVALAAAVIACGTPPGVTRLNTPVPIVDVLTDVPTQEPPTPIVVLPSPTVTPTTEPTATYTSTPSVTPLPTQTATTVPPTVVPPTAVPTISDPVEADFDAVTQSFIDDGWTVIDDNGVHNAAQSTLTSDRTTCAAWDVDEVVIMQLGEKFEIARNYELTCGPNGRWIEFPTAYDFLPVVAKGQQELPGGWILAREAEGKGQTSDPYLPWSFTQQFSASRDVQYAEAHWAHPTLFAINPTETISGLFVINRLTLEEAQKIAAAEGGTIANNPYDNQRMGRSMVAIFIGGRGVVTIKKGDEVLYDNLAIRLAPCTTCKGYTQGIGPLDWSGNDGEPDPSAHYGKVNLIIPFERDLDEEITIEFQTTRLPRRSGEPGALYWWFGAYEPPAR